MSSAIIYEREYYAYSENYLILKEGAGFLGLSQFSLKGNADALKVRTYVIWM